MSKRLSGEQKAFNAVVRHLRKQGAKAQGGKNQPLYVYKSNINGNRCAIGGIIPIKMLSLKLTGTVEVLFREHKDILDYLQKKYEGVSMKFYKTMQSIHDSVRPENWEESLAYFASENGLKMPK